jgi:hypothetical protein
MGARLRLCGHCSEPAHVVALTIIREGETERVHLWMPCAAGRETAVNRSMVGTD